MPEAVLNSLSTIFRQTHAEDFYLLMAEYIRRSELLQKEEQRIESLKSAVVVAIGEGVKVGAFRNNINTEATAEQLVLMLKGSLLDLLFYDIESIINHYNIISKSVLTGLTY